MMKKTEEVSYKKLKYTCNPNIFKFDTTDELKNDYRGVGNYLYKKLFRQIV